MFNVAIKINGDAENCHFPLEADKNVWFKIIYYLNH